MASSAVVRRRAWSAAQTAGLIAAVCTALTLAFALGMYLALGLLYLWLAWLV